MFRVGAQPLPSCSFARQLLGKMVIRCSVACPRQHSPENVVVVLLKGRQAFLIFTGELFIFREGGHFWRKKMTRNKIHLKEVFAAVSSINKREKVTVGHPSLLDMWMQIAGQIPYYYKWSDSV